MSATERLNKSLTHPFFYALYYIVISIISTVSRSDFVEDRQKLTQINMVNYNRLLCLAYKPLYLGLQNGNSQYSLSINMVKYYNIKQKAMLRGAYG